MSRKLCLIFFAIWIAYALALWAGFRDGFPPSIRTGSLRPYLSDRPVEEDGFYVLTVAWHMAQGQGVVYNFGEKTTGLQPAITIIFAGIAWIVRQFGGDKWDFIRATFLWSIFNLLLFAHLLGSLTTILCQPEKRKTAYRLSFFATLFNFALFRLFSCGLETGLYLTCLAVLLLAILNTMSDIGETNARKLYVLGLLAGLAGLARIDFGVVLGIFLLLAWRMRILKLRHAMLMGFVAFLVVLPWFVWVYSVTGHIMPSSGVAQSTWISQDNALLRLTRMGMSLMDHLTPWSYSGQRPMLAGIELIMLAIFCWWARPAFACCRTMPGLPKVFIWTLALTTLLPVYLCCFHSTYFYTRYLAPILVVVLPFFYVLVVTRCSEPRIPLAIGIFMLSFFASCAFSFHSGKVSNPHAVAAGFVKNELSQNLKIGSFQSGTLGYFHSRVVNLDGKMNDKVLPYLQKNRLPEYLDANGIQVLIDWPLYLDVAFSQEYRIRCWQPYPKQLPDAVSLCWLRK